MVINKERRREEKDSGYEKFLHNKFFPVALSLFNNATKKENGRQ